MADHGELLNRRIFDNLKRIKREKLSRSIGIVTDDSPLTVEIAGEEIADIKRLASYSPTIGDRVWISRADGDLVCHGEISPGGAGSPGTDVTEFGAAGDGVTDDRPAIQTAIDTIIAAGGGGLYLPAGTYYLGSVGPLLLPTGTETLRIFGDGRGITKFLLSSTCSGAFTFDRSADHDTFQGYELCDFTVDADNISSELAAIIGSVDSSRNILQRINIDNIVIRRVESINVPVDRTLTDIRRNIALLSGHAGANEGTQNRVANILVEDCDLQGGIAGVEVFGWSPATTEGTNIYVNNVTVSRIWHSSITAPSSATAGSSVHIGSKGFGGWCRVRDCYSRFSGDVGIEINAMSDAVVSGCKVDDSAGPSFYYTHYNYPALGGGSAPSSSNTTIDQQQVVFENCRAHRVSYTPTASQSGFRTDDNYSIPLGSVVFRGCVYTRQGTGANCQADALASIGPARAFIVDDFQATVTGLSASGTDDEILIRLRDGAVGETILRNIRTKVEGTRTGGTPKVKALEVGTGSFATKLLIDNFSVEFDLASWTGPAYGMLIGNDDCTLTASEISRVRLIDWAGVPGSAWQGIYIGDSNLTITDRLLITNCDLKAAGAGGDIGFTSSPTNIEKVYVRDIDWSSTPSSSAVASAATITLPLGRPFYTITGTTGITSITASYVDHLVCLKFTDASPGQVTDGSNLNLAGNFNPTTNDTLTLICDGTDWNEVGRSTN